MKNFVIDSTNNIRVHASDRAGKGGLGFASAEELAALAQPWSNGRFAEIWNKLPGAAPIRRFRDRNTAVRRIWQAVQKLELTKTERVIDLLRQPSGATIEALIALTGWQPHSCEASSAPR